MASSQTSDVRQTQPNILSLVLGKYLNRVDRVMTLVDKISEDIEHIPVATFIFRDSESVMVDYTSDIEHQDQIRSVDRSYNFRHRNSPALVSNSFQFTLHSLVISVKIK